jgi:hypothetical protein
VRRASRTDDKPEAESRTWSIAWRSFPEPEARL